MNKNLILRSVALTNEEGKVISKRQFTTDKLGETVMIYIPATETQDAASQAIVDNYANEVRRRRRQRQR